ncbi:MAG: GTP cyclohydrolase I [Conexivisphaerales archaeon]
MAIDDIQSKLENLFHEMIFDVLKLDQRGVPLQHVEDTPRRIAKMLYTELLAGCFTEAPKVTVFNNSDHEHSVVVVRDLSVKSLCSHHFMPFYGKCTIAYVPDEKVAGLSKFARIVSYFSAKPQIQEELTKQIVNYLASVIDPLAIGARMECVHTCMSHRGAKSNGSMVTEYIKLKSLKDTNLTQAIKSELMTNV